MDLMQQSRSHYGIVTVAQWIASGKSRASWFRRLDRELIRIGPGVARFAAVERSPAQRILGAVLATPDAVASHRSAAFLWGAAIDGDDPVDITSPRRSAKTSVENVIIHRPTDIAELRPVPRLGVPTTNPMRTLLDLGAVRPDLVKVSLEAILIAGTVSIEGMHRVLAEHRKRGRSGVAALDAALSNLPLPKPADSVLEYEMASLLRGAGIDGWIFHQTVGRYEVDFGLPRYRVAIEVDGWAFHADRFEADRIRDNDLAALGWLVLRFTWTQVKHKSASVATQIRLALAARPQFSAP
jgi:very-short-patch-repair endonuclease